MNCQNFKAVLHEFLDETLRSDVQTAAREHVEQCGDCRRAVMLEETFVKSIRSSLDRATAGLSLDPTVRHSILALQSRSSRSSAWSVAWKTLTSTALRPALSAAAVCLVLIMAALHFYRGTEPPPKGNATAPLSSWVIHVPIPVQRHVFQHENKMVVDTVIDDAAVGHASFFESENRSLQTSPKEL